MGGTARAVGNLYDLDGNRIRVIHPDSSFFTYELDGLGRLGGLIVSADLAQMRWCIAFRPIGFRCSNSGTLETRDTISN